MADPFAPRAGRVAAVARRLGCTEGQLYSMVIGLLLLWTVSANALPHVVWEHDIAAAPRSVAPATTAPPPPTPVERPAGPLPAPAVEQVASPLVPPPVPPPADPQPPATDPPSPATAPDPAPEPLTISAAGWASAAVGSPLATLGVPEGSVPVTRRGGSPFNVAFLRLSGNAGPFELAVDDSGTSTPTAFAGIDLCAVTDEVWEVGRGDTSLDDAPDYDCGRAVAGVPSASGDRWTFDVAALGAASLPGVALVPAGDFPEFQIVFRTEEER